ncbi:DNA alkylation repair protein [Paenibacillus sp. JSM ZJ436]|uniref:DNA alkylation repair protein n=1 Tax=Paenibacillus sp. JSM ZJ436 TaxID=3376190 RepID=UPI00378FD5DC
MELSTVMQELSSLGKERTRNIYLSQGAREPLFGVATGAMKPLAKQIKIHQSLADELYATGNYDAMYFAGIIADPAVMTEADFETWIEGAYFYMLSDYVVAVTLAESERAQTVADRWIQSGEELKMSAGWSCYCWLMGNRPDDAFDRLKLAGLLQQAQDFIHSSPERTKAAMNNFIYTAGISYVPLHAEAVETARQVGVVEVKRGNSKTSRLDAYHSIQKDVEKGRLGFKRKYVRC